MSIYLGTTLPPKGLQLTDSNPNIARDRRKRVRKTAVQYRDTTGSVGSFNVICWAHNPSARLRWAITAAFELANGTTLTLGAVAPTWSMTAMRRNPLAGKAAQLNSVFSARALPDGYELDSAMRDAEILLAVSNQNLPASVEAELVLECSWEPNGPPDDETERLLAVADLSVATSTNGQPLILQT